MKSQPPVLKVLKLYPVHVRFHDSVVLYPFHKAIVVKIVDGTQNHLACCFFHAALQCASEWLKHITFMLQVSFQH
jgi:hypothetical protein